MNALATLVSTFFYVGLSPIAPGTVGSAAALLLFAAVRAGGNVIEGAAIVVLTAGGIWSAGLTERRLGTDDPGQVVIDEVIGMLLALAFVPVGLSGAVAGFCLFRLFDIIKPYPCARVERLPGGLGIVADDVVAGLYANLALRALVWAVPALA